MRQRTSGAVFFARRGAGLILAAVFMLIAAGTFTVFGDSFPGTAPKNFVPKDQGSISYIDYQNNMALMYQYRIDFFHNVGPSEAKKIGQETWHGRPRVGIRPSVRPYKSMTFQERITWKFPSPYEGPAAAVCTDPTIPYSSKDPEESAVVGRGGIIARNPKGKFHNFCGVIGVDGTIIAQMPRPWKLPIYKPLGILSDGKEALFGAGHWGTILYKYYDEMAANEHNAFVYQYLIHWTYPNKIKKIRIGALSVEKFNALREKFGVHILNQDVYEHAIK